MEELHILRPFHTPRDVYRPRTVLVVAAEGCLEIPDDLKTFTEGSNGLNVRIAKKLPLPCGDKHPPIDVVVFVYKVFNKASLETIQESISYMDVRYLAGKCFILVFSDCQYFLTDTKDIEEFAKRLNLPIHYATKQRVNTSGKACLQLPSQLLSVYCPPMGSDVNSLIIDSVMNHNT